MSRLFGTDGIRGHAGHFPTTPEIALALGKALGSVLRRNPGKHRVVVGKDTRRSCYFFENAMVAGLCSMGIDTLVLGPLPTPGVAFVTMAYRAAAGVMISASHNPFFDNGIKIFNSEGYKLSDELEEEIEQIVLNSDFGPLPDDHEIGRNTRIDDVAGRYIEYCKATIPRGQTLNGFRLFLDCANGATYKVAPAVFWELGAEVIVRGDQPNGLNINDNCGALHPAELQTGVIEHHTNAGLAFDGDGDRLQMVDERGQLLDGDQILAICAKYLLEKGELPNNRVVMTVMSNLGIVKHLEESGIEVLLSKVGDRNVLAEMLNHDAFLGGEPSGHLLFRDYSTTGDGVIAALQVLHIMKESGKTLTELAEQCHKYPQHLINLPVQKKPPLNELDKVTLVLKEAEATLANEGRVLVRYSGTEPICRILVEGQDKDKVQRVCENIANVIHNEIGVCAGSPVI